MAAKKPNKTFFLNFFSILLFLSVVSATIILIVFFSTDKYDPKDVYKVLKGRRIRSVSTTGSDTLTTPRDTKCTFHTCVNVYNCGHDDRRTLSIYVYPLEHIVDEDNNDVTLSLSKEYYEILKAIVDSPYYTSNPDNACLFVPSIDLLNQNHLRLREIGIALASLPWWNDGTNHILFNLLPGSAPEYSTVLEVDTGKAIIAGGGFSTWSYRRTFDVSVPVYNPIISHDVPARSYLEKRDWFLISSQIGLHSEYQTVIDDITAGNPQVLTIDRCPGEEKPWNFSRRCHQDKVLDYPDILKEGTFCMVLRGARLGQTTLSDALMMNCIPVIVADGYILPFSEVLDWNKAAVVIREDDLPETLSVLHAISDAKILQMQQHVRFFWENYFSSMKKITLTTLQILNDRVFPYVGKSYEDWNDIPNKKSIRNQLFLPMRPPSSQGFTAVILTYNRLQSLLQVIKQVAKVPSLAKVVVVWNNQQVTPPPPSSWVDIGKPIKIIKTTKNVLSNRFFPFEEIETECILALDDDIVMLTADEMEFGYEVWREFPDRLVGFPSREHVFDNVTGKWKYDSEWTNSISMVLTGAAFYHKYYSFVYTYQMPSCLRELVDDHMNCEDLAMNFLIANATGKAPIKVTPKKKFKCPECTNTEMLSADLVHMIERSECINKMAETYGYMPLKNVEFRADPVLYKDDIPSVLKKYNDIGSL